MNEQPKLHDIIIRSRSKVEISGVTNVVSFDEEGICLESEMGEMLIEGRGLRVSSLDTDRGKIYIDGTIDGLYYNTNTNEPKKGLFGRLLS